MPTSLKRFLGSVALFTVTLLVCLVGAEIVTRIVDDQPVFVIRLPEVRVPIGVDTTAERLDEVPRATGFERAWFFEEPPPLPNRHAVPAAWMALDRRIEQGGSPTGFMPWDMFKQWNAAFVGDPCRLPFFTGAPGFLWAYDPPSGDLRPPFRYLPNATTPMGLVSNELGWRGGPVTIPRRDNSLRIVFVGASTTAGAHGAPFSYPELAGHWLRQWAAKVHPGLQIEALNAGRESINSTDIVDIVRQEVAPLHPDLVVFYEGGNQFDLRTVARGLPDPLPKPPDAAPPVPTGLGLWLRGASAYSAFARRLQALAGMFSVPEGGKEAPKPDYSIAWPAGLDERDPDIRRDDLPVNLSLVLGNLDRMREELAGVGADFAVSSFMWMVRDGLELHRIRNRLMWEYLNIRMYPWRYRDIERLAAFQNRVLRKYAASRGIPFIDPAGAMPFDPNLFADAVHNTYPGMRLHGWIVAQQLAPIIEAKLAAKAWPRRIEPFPTPPIFLAPVRELPVACAVPATGTR